MIHLLNLNIVDVCESDYRTYIAQWDTFFIHSVSEYYEIYSLRRIIAEDKRLNY